MKLTVLLIAASLCANAEGLAQKVNLSLKNASLEQVFNQVKLQTGFSFIWDEPALKGTHPVDINVKNASVPEVMDLCLKDQFLVYQIVGKIIVIRQETEIAPPAENIMKAMPPPVDITGRVTNTKNEPLEGVSVTVKGMQTGTTTNADGRFQLSVPSANKVELIFSFVGYITQTIRTGSQQVFNIVMEEAVSDLSDVVVVGYGKEKKVNLTGAVSSISSKELTTTTNSNITNMLTGKLPGFRAIQRTAEPGDYNTSFDIRGLGSPLIIVDGVPRDDFNRLDPNEIESISILKDASAAVYGVRAANGVLLVTTKRGKTGTTELSYSGTFGGTSIDKPTPMNAYQFALLTDEANINQGSTLPPVYSQETLEKYKDGTLPTTDWQSLVMRKLAPQTQQTLIATGGNEKVKYFTSLGYYKEDGVWKTGDLNYKRFNLRSNITANITKSLQAEILLSGMWDQKMEPGQETWLILKSLWTTRPNIPAYANNNPDYLNQVEGDVSNPLAATNASISGYKKKAIKSFKGNFGLTYEVPFIEGLTAKLMYGYDLKYLFQKTWQKQYLLYNYNSADDIYEPVTMNSPGNLSELYDEISLSNVQVSLNYSRTFGGKHNFKLLGLFEQSQYNLENLSGSRMFSLSVLDQLYAGNSAGQQIGSSPSSPTFTVNGTPVNKIANQGYVGRLNYDYRGKYLVEGSFRYDGSSKFAPGHRWGFFPAISAGWRISEEPFIKDNIPQITNLKLRVSQGKLGDDAASTFQFLSGYIYPAPNDRNGNGDLLYYVFDNIPMTLLSPPGIANPNITWFTSSTSNIGMDGSLWMGKLGFSVDFFQRKRKGLLANRLLSLPGTVGAYLPQENLNSDLTRGIEVSLSHSNNIGKLRYNISGNISFTRTKNIYLEQADYSSQYDNWRNNQANRWNDVFWGFGVLGQFTSQEQIDKAPLQDQVGNTTLSPGDLIYEDYNKDGRIDDNDIHPLARNNQIPGVNFGTTISLSWKAFDLNMLFQGISQYWVEYTESWTNPLPFGRNGLDIFMDRWHKEDIFDKTSAWVPGKYPSTLSKAYNGRPSLFWRYNASYVRLKSLEVGYSLPGQMLRKAGIKRVRVYVNAFNPLTWSKLKFVDPEHSPGEDGKEYPIVKNYNIGVNVTF
ncbi:MAG: TonB-dependent receptor [Sphingobacteriales bacterium]|nr:TonB-dependent receptor [Sphingobacteriales bacterium]